MERIRTVFTSLGDGLTRIAPGLALAVATIVVGVIAAKLLKSLSRISVQHMLDAAPPRVRSGLSPIDSKNLALSVSRFVYALTILVFAILASEVYGFDVVEYCVKLIAAYLPTIVGAFAVFISGTFASGLVRQFVLKSGKSVGFIAPERVALICYAAGMTITFLIAVKQLGIEIEFLTTALLIVVASLLIGGAISFGLGSAPVVTNILSAYYARKTIKVGSVVAIEGMKGTVVEVSGTSFILKTDSSRLIIPGKKINNAIVELMGTNA